MRYILKSLTFLVQNSRMNNNGKKVFGWKSVFQNYTFVDALNDCKYPACISLILTLMIAFFSSNIFVSWLKIVSWSINIIPGILALLLAGYAIVFNRLLV